MQISSVRNSITPQLVVSTPNEAMAPVSTPNGDTIVFADGTSQYPGLRRDVFTVSADGTNLHQLTNGYPNLSWQPAVSPDGQQIAYVVEKDGHADLHVMSLDGSHDANLTRTDAGYWEPQWSPDGKQILVTSHEAGGLDLYTFNADGSGRRRLTSQGENRGAHYTPDGSHIVFLSNRKVGYDQVYCMNADGTDVHRRSNNIQALEAPSLSADGHAVFSAVNHQGNIDIYSVTLDHNSQKKLAAGGMSMSPTFSPDGTKVAYLHAQGDEPFQVYEANADGSNPQALTHDKAFHLAPSYMPDGKSLLLVADYDGKDQLYKLSR